MALRSQNFLPHGEGTLQSHLQQNQEAPAEARQGLKLQKLQQKPDVFVMAPADDDEGIYRLCFADRDSDSDELVSSGGRWQVAEPSEYNSWQERESGVTTLNGGEASKPPVVEGPWFFKLLVPSYAAGAMIGKSGSGIAEIEKHTACQIQISANDHYFPGTKDRILLAGGPGVKDVDACLTLVIHRLSAFVQKSSLGAIIVKMVVPKSSVSQIIGKSGHRLQKLSKYTGCNINVSARNDGIQERLMLFSGTETSVLSAARCVYQQLQQDAHLVEHMNFDHHVELPLGVWDCARSGPAEPEHPLIRVQDCEAYTRRELIEYLLKAAPRDLLLKHRLLGSVQKSLKRHSMEAVLAVVEETWRARTSYQYQQSLDPAKQVFMATEDDIEIDDSGDVVSMLLYSEQ